MAFPYGICHLNINEYANFIQSNNVNTDKDIKLINQSATLHDNLPNNHIRKMYDIFGKNSGKRINYSEFLTNILKSEFVISTSGDRDDCYRHYECIGLNAIPLSNISYGYKDIFGDNMIYTDAEEIIDMINKNIVNYEYKKPNRDMLTINYWVCKINQKISSLKTI